MTTETITLLAVAVVLAILFTLVAVWLAGRAKPEIPVLEEKGALVGYHALLASEASAKKAVSDAQAALAAIQAEIADFKTAVAGAS